MKSYLKIMLAFGLFSLLQGAIAVSGETTITVVIETDQGNIDLELYPERVPVTVENFVQNIKDGLYEGGRFYRASRPDNNFTTKRKVLTLIQGGKNEQKQERSPIAHETSQQTDLSHLDGIISMARLEPGTATSEFFICIGDNSGLDYGSTRYDVGQRQGYASFGRVTKGMDVVISIQQKPTGDKAKDDQDWFGHQVINDTVIIKHMRIK